MLSQYECSATLYCLHARCQAALRFALLNFLQMAIPFVITC